MKVNVSVEEEKIHFVCKGKFKNAREFLDLKEVIFSELAKNPTIQDLIFSFDTFPIDLSLLGVLLLLNRKYKIQIFVTNYSNFKMLEDLLLLEKFNIRYEKGS